MDVRTWLECKRLKLAWYPAIWNLVCACPWGAEYDLVRAFVQLFNPPLSGSASSYQDWFKVSARLKWLACRP